MDLHAMIVVSLLDCELKKQFFEWAMSEGRE